jgi:hypothetical protein
MEAPPEAVTVVVTDMVWFVGPEELIAVPGVLAADAAG